MKRFIGLASIVAFGAGVLWTSSSLGETAPNDPAQNSDEIDQPFADEAQLIQFAPQESEKSRQELIFEGLAKLRVEALERRPVSLPDGVQDFPFGLPFLEPKSDYHWPALDAPDIQAMLDAEKDNWVILNYWATWCAPCIHELPDMNDASAPLSEIGVSLIALNVDPMGKDTPDTIRAFLAKRGISDLANATVSGPDIHNAMAAGGMKMPGSFRYPLNIVFAPGGVPYGYFESLPMPLDGSPVWNSDAMLSFFEALVTSDVS